MRYFILAPLLVLTACTGPTRDYDASAACAERGIMADAPGYADCVKEERGARLLKQEELREARRQQYEQEQKAYRSVLPR